MKEETRTKSVHFSSALFFQRGTNYMIVVNRSEDGGDWNVLCWFLSFFVHGGVCGGSVGDEKLVEESCANNGW